MSALDALLGRVLSNDVEIELSSGLNFKQGLAATKNPATGLTEVSFGSNADHGSLQPADGIHGIVSGLGPYTTAALRRAQVLASTDVGKVALQTDTTPPTMWTVLAVTSGVGTWSRIDTGAESLGPPDPSVVLGSALLAWYRGDTVVTATGVSQWTDKSGNGNHLLQATGASQPTYNAADSTLNNLGSLTGNGSSQEMLCAAGVLPAAYYACAVLKINAFGSGSNVAFSSPGGSGRAMFYWNAINALYLFENGSFNGPTAGATSGAWKRIAGMQSNAATDFIQAGGAAKVTGALGRTASTTAWRVFSTGGAQFFNGAYGELILANRALTGTEQTAIDTYLSNRYFASLLT